MYIEYTTQTMTISVVIQTYKHNCKAIAQKKDIKNNESYNSLCHTFMALNKCKK